MRPLRKIIRLNISSLKYLLISSLILVLFILLFIDSDAQQNHRLIKDIWNAGHLVLFGLLSFVYLHLSKITKRSLLHQIIVITLFSLLIGTAIEFVQLLFKRDFSYNDIFNDLIGGYLGFCFFVLTDKTKKVSLRLFYALAFIMLAVLGLRELEKNLLDEYRMRNSFPVLADFENDLEKSRWEYLLVKAEYSTEYVTSGKTSLKAKYLPGRYSTLSLEHFINDWRGFRFLSFSIYNPQTSPLDYAVTIFDAQHNKTGRRYSDRFNKRIQIQPGWNNIRLSIDKIIQAPKQRTMVANQIKGVYLFTSRLKQPITLYIDSIRLEK